MITNIKQFKESFGFNIPKVQPKTKTELIEIIEKTIENSPKDNKVDLNFIDTSLITDMSSLFYYIDRFNGDISNWDVSNVNNMAYMFRNSEFNGDISNWDVSNVTNMKYMFKYSPLESNPPSWYKESNVDTSN